VVIVTEDGSHKITIVGIKKKKKNHHCWWWHAVVTQDGDAVAMDRDDSD
jgi:hypothetical protein